MSSPSPEVTVILPAYHEAAVIGQVVGQLRALYPDYEVLVVDDGSRDGTGAAAEQAGARVVRHPYNKGNGAAVKTGIRNARGEVLVMMDGDGQHDPQDVARLLEYLPEYDMVVGARSRAGQAGLHRAAANSFYNRFASYLAGEKIEDLTSGFRAVKADIARQFVAILPNGFSYPSTLTMAVVRSGYALKYVPIQVAKRVGKSKIKLLRDGVRFVTILLRISMLFAPFKVFLPIAAAGFLLGGGYGSYALFFQHRASTTSHMLIINSVLIFLIGLVAEQIALLRMERKE